MGENKTQKAVYLPLYNLQSEAYRKKRLVTGTQVKISVS